MHTISFADLKLFAEKAAKTSLNVDLFWGSQAITVYPQENRKAYFKLFKNLARVSHKRKPHKKDNGHTLMTSDIPKIVHHFQTVGTFPPSTIKVIP